MQRGARFAFCDRLAIHSRLDSAGADVNGKTNAFFTFFHKSRSHAAWRSNRSAPLGRAARSRVGFSNIWGFSRFYRVASLAFSRFVFRYIRGRPFHDLKFCFSGLALWCFIFHYAALSFLHFLVSPWIAFWVVGPGWGPGLRWRQPAFPCSVALV